MVLKKIAEFLAGDSDRKALASAHKLVPQVNEWFEKFVRELASEEAFKAKTLELKDRVQNKGESLDDLLPEAFGLVKAACKLR